MLVVVGVTDPHGQCHSALVIARGASLHKTAVDVANSGYLVQITSAAIADPRQPRGCPRFGVGLQTIADLAFTGTAGVSEVSCTRFAPVTVNVSSWRLPGGSSGGDHCHLVANVGIQTSGTTSPTRGGFE